MTADRHGITTVDLGDDPAGLVVTHRADRIYFDLADFQTEAEGLLVVCRLNSDLS
jgi:hypothetical protein